MVKETGLYRLEEYFGVNQLEWRMGHSGVGKTGTPWGIVFAYVTNRAVQDRLDLVCGKGGWWNEFRPGPSGGVVCGLTIRFEDEARTVREVTKWDGAENTDIESVKGGISDSMKRAAVEWGVGRYLYDLPEFYVTFVPKGDLRAKIDSRWVYYNTPKLPDWAIPKKEVEQSVPVTRTVVMENQSSDSNQLF